MNKTKWYCTLIFLQFILCLDVVYSSIENQEVFSILKKNVSCPFAKTAKIWENKTTWDITRSIENNIDDFIEKDLIPFLKMVDFQQKNAQRPLDGIALEAPAYIYAKNEQYFAEFFRRVLNHLNPKSVQELQKLTPNEDGYYLDDGWQFTFNNMRLFIITVAPYYDAHSSRYNYDGKNAIILFQTEESFRFVLGKDREKKIKLKKGVRERFAKKGQSYEGNIVPNLDLNIKTHEAPRYIKPIRPNLPAVKWWIENKNVDFNNTSVDDTGKDYDEFYIEPIGCYIL